MTRKITLVTAALLALFAGNAVAGTSQKSAPAGYASTPWPAANAQPNGDFQLQGR